MVCRVGNVAGMARVDHEGHPATREYCPVTITCGTTTNWAWRSGTTHSQDDPQAKQDFGFVPLPAAFPLGVLPGRGQGARALAGRIPFTALASKCQ